MRGKLLTKSAICGNFAHIEEIHYHKTMNVVFPGTFDPPTNGHINIIERCSRLFVRMDVVIADNLKKNPLLSPQERYQLLSDLLKEHKNVRVIVWDKLLVDYLRTEEITIIVRGVRSSVDYEYEYSLSQINKGLGKSIGKNIETLLLPTDEKYYLLRSSVIREIIHFGGDVSDKVPQKVLTLLKEKISLAN